MSIILNGLAKAGDFGGQVVNGIACVPANAGMLAVSITLPITGIVGTVLSCLAGGKVDRFNKSASNTQIASLILPVMYKTVIGCFDEKVFKKPTDENSDLGYCREKFDLFSKAMTYHNEANGNGQSKTTIFKKHFVTRGYFFAAAIVAVITRVADFILGVGTALVSLACLGQWNEANEFAAKNLTVLGIIDDLSRGIRGVFNPAQTHLKRINLFSPPPSPPTTPPTQPTPPPTGSTGSGETQTSNNQTQQTEVDL